MRSHDAEGAAKSQAGMPGGSSAVMRSKPTHTPPKKGGKDHMAKKAKAGKKKGGKKR